MTEAALPPGRAVFRAYNSPLFLAQYFQIPPMYSWQVELVAAMMMPKARVICSTCNEAGKTNILIPLIGLSFMCAFPGCTVFSTAGSEEQIKGQLFKYLDAKLRPYRDWRVSTADLEVIAPRVADGFPVSRWIGRVPKDVKTAEGYHGSWVQIGGKGGPWHWCPVLCIVDEAKSAGEEVFELMDRIDPDALFVISTPGNDTGPFYQAMEVDSVSGQADVWTYRKKVSWLDCPHLLTEERKKVRERLILKHGEKSSFIQSFLYGRFQRDTDENLVFREMDIEAMKSSMGVSDTPMDKPVTGEIMRAGLEFSGGGDEQVIMIAKGGSMVFSDAFREEDTSKIAKTYVETLRKFKVEPGHCTADNGGLGLAVIDSMESMGYRPINRYMNNQEAINKKEYVDRMSEDHFNFRELIHKHGIRLHKDMVLLDQAKRRRFSYQGDHNQIKLEPKTILRKRGEESPDRLDCLMMLFSDWHSEVTEKQEEEYRSVLEEAAQKVLSTGAFAGVCKQPNLQELARLAGQVLPDVERRVHRIRQ